jgi:hypothetical protein
MGQSADAGASHGKDEQPDGCVVALDTYEQSCKKESQPNGDELQPILRK